MSLSVKRIPEARLGLAALALVLLIAALHFGLLGRHSMANNEFITLRVVRLHTVGEVIKDRVNNNHSPGYFLLVRAFTKVFGDGQVALRFPSAFFSFVGILALWRLGAFLYGRRLGLLALAFAGLSQALLQLSGDTRMYSMLFCALALALFAAVRFLEGGGARYGALLVAAGLIGLSAQLLYIIGPLCLAAWCAWNWRTFSKRRAWLIFCAVLPIILFIPIIMWWKSVQYKVGVYKHPHPINLFTVFRNVTALFFGDPEFFREDSDLGRWNFLLIVAGLVLTLRAAKKGKTEGGAPAPLETRYLGLLWLWCLAPVVLIALSGMKSDDNVIKLWRYYVMTASAAPLLLVAMVEALGRMGRPRWAAAAAVYMLLTILLTTVNFIRWDGPGLREVAQYIQPKLQAGDVVIASMMRRRTDSFIYYGMKTRPLEVPYEMTDLEVTGGKPLQPILPWLRAQCAPHKRLWAIYYNHKDDLLYKAVKGAKAEFTPLEKKLYVGGETSVGLYEIHVVKAEDAAGSATAPGAMEIRPVGAAPEGVRLPE